jgi:hypothetical protein
MVIVWFSIYLSILYSRRHPPKIEQRRPSSIYITQDSITVGEGIAGSGYEDSIILTSLDV